MLSYPGPTPNIERQRQFRERNPGYYQRLHAKRRAEVDALVAAQALAAKREPLMLPAPVETIEIPGMTTIAAIPTRLELPVPAEMSEQATIPPLPAKSLAA